MEEKKHYFLGIIGGFIGGMIASIPWILMYIYGNMMFSMLAIFIAMGAFHGYRICKGTIDNKLPMIITVLSLLSITVATLVIIPMALLAKNGYDATFENLKILYEYESFVEAITKDYIIAFIFTLLGISGVTSQLKRGLEPKWNTPQNIVTKNMADEIQQMKETFQNLNAMQKETAVTKETILETVTIPNAEQVFRTLSMQQIIRKYKKKYYFDEKLEQSFLKRFFLLYGKIMKWLILFVVAFLFLCIVIF